MVLVGNSMGGFVASEVAIQFAGPRRAAGARLRRRHQHHGGARGAAADARPCGLAPRPPTPSRASARSPAGRCRATWRSRWSRAIPSLLKPDLAYEGFISGAGKPGFNDAFRATLEYDARHRLPEIGCPTLVVWGEKDAIIPVQDAHHFERADPGRRKLVMRDTGHISMAERPRAFNDALESFLAERGAAEHTADQAA